MKGNKNIHELKKIGQVSGGFIRSLVWAGVAVIQDDKTIKLVKGIKKSDLPDPDEATERPAKKDRKPGKDKPSNKDKKMKAKSRKIEADEDEDEDEEEEQPKAKKSDKKADKEPAKKKGKEVAGKKPQSRK